MAAADGTVGLAAAAVLLGETSLLLLRERRPGRGRATVRCRAREGDVSRDEMGEACCDADRDLEVPLRALCRRGIGGPLSDADAADCELMRRADEEESCIATSGEKGAGASAGAGAGVLALDAAAAAAASVGKEASL